MAQTQPSMACAARQTTESSAHIAALIHITLALFVANLLHNPEAATPSSTTAARSMTCATWYHATCTCERVLQQASRPTTHLTTVKLNSTTLTKTNHHDRASPIQTSNRSPLGSACRGYFPLSCEQAMATDREATVSDYGKQGAGNSWSQTGKPKTGKPEEATE